MIHRTGSLTKPEGARLETIRFIIANLPVIWQRTLEHIMLVGVAVAIAIVTGVTIGIADHPEQARGRPRALRRGR